MKPHARHAVVVLLGSASLAALVALVSHPNRERAVLCADPQYGSSADSPTEPAFRCVPDNCSLATVRAMNTIELQAARLGEAQATDPRVRTTAGAMARDFEEDQANLDALEAQLAVAEQPCAESRKVAAELGSAEVAAVGTAFDHTFVTSQLAALSEMKRVINLDLIGCAANGNLKATLRFERLRTSRWRGAAAAAGMVPDLAALRALLGRHLPARPLFHRSRGPARVFSHPESS